MTNSINTLISRPHSPYQHDNIYARYGQVPARDLRQHLAATELPDPEFKYYLAHRRKEVA